MPNPVVTANSLMTEQHDKRVRTARITGMWYLVLAISGMVGFLVLHPMIYIADDPAKTLDNLSNQETTARIRILLEVVIVGAQALAAVWFYKLFREIDSWKAGNLRLWGTVNSVAIMISAMAMGAAVALANAAGSTGIDRITSVVLLQQIMSNAWGIGSLFFGLWLIPMGSLVIKSGWMPVWLGRILMIGGVGYILNTFFRYAGVGGDLSELLVIPATVGEFWMIGYLLIFGVRRTVGNS